MKKTFFIFIIAFSSLQSAYLFENNNKCVDDYYTNGGALFYKVSGATVYTRIATSNLVSKMLDGYDYNATSLNCVISPKKITLGMDTTNYYFLLGLSGLIFSSIIFATLATFLIGL
ncbi:MAG: hypothetical protein WC656_11840 [Sulfurimonas sp.]|jgi:hypothetical protein